MSGRDSQLPREIAPHRDRTQAFMEKQDGQAIPRPGLKLEPDIVDDQG
jgi:hypothetical protein